MEYLTILLLVVVVVMQSAVLVYTFKRFNPLRKSLSEKELLPSYRRKDPTSSDYDVELDHLACIVEEGVKFGLTDWEVVMVKGALLDNIRCIKGIPEGLRIQDMIDNGNARHVLRNINIGGV